MKVACVIPARWGSTRLPGKSLRPLLGKPLVQWVVARALEARRIDQVIVATDDSRIGAAAAAAGALAVMTRPDHPSGTDRAAEAVAGRDFDLIINVQGDEPLIDPRLIDRLAETMAAGDCPMATAATPIADAATLRNPAVVKVVRDHAGNALYFSRAPIPFRREAPCEAAPDLHFRHLGIYAYRADFLRRLVAQPPCELEVAEKLEQLRALHIGAAIRVILTDAAGVSVDTPEDLPLAEAALRAALEARPQPGEFRKTPLTADASGFARPRRTRGIASPKKKSRNRAGSCKTSAVAEARDPPSLELGVFPSTGGRQASAAVPRRRFCKSLRDSEKKNDA